MPQLEAVTYLCQYIWKLIILFFLFSILVNSILPKLQWQIVTRDQFSSVKKERIKLEIILLI